MFLLVMRLDVGHVCFIIRNLILTLLSEILQTVDFQMHFTVEFQGEEKWLGNKPHKGSYKSAASSVVLNVLFAFCLIILALL